MSNLNNASRSGIAMILYSSLIGMVGSENEERFICLKPCCDKGGHLSEEIKFDTVMTLLIIFRFYGVDEILNSESFKTPCECDSFYFSACQLQDTYFTDDMLFGENYKEGGAFGNLQQVIDNSPGGIPAANGAYNILIDNGAPEGSKAVIIPAVDNLVFHDTADNFDPSSPSDIPSDMVSFAMEGQDVFVTYANEYTSLFQFEAGVAVFKSLVSKPDAVGYQSNPLDYADPTNPTQAELNAVAAASGLENIYFIEIPQSDEDDDYTWFLNGSIWVLVEHPTIDTVESPDTWESVALESNGGVLPAAGRYEILVDPAQPVGSRVQLIATFDSYIHHDTVDNFDPLNPGNVPSDIPAFVENGQTVEVEYANDYVASFEWLAGVATFRTILRIPEEEGFLSDNSDYADFNNPTQAELNAVAAGSGQNNTIFIEIPGSGEDSDQTWFYNGSVWVLVEHPNQVGSASNLVFWGRNIDQGWTISNTTGDCPMPLDTVTNPEAWPLTANSITVPAGADGIYLITRRIVEGGGDGVELLSASTRFGVRVNSGITDWILQQEGTSDTASESGACILELAGNDVITLRCDNNTGPEFTTFFQHQLWIQRIG